MMEETPGKVLGLLVTACTSMLLLFLVSASNMSFTGHELAIPDPFSQAKVVSVIDNSAAAYSGFLADYLFKPAQQDYAFWSDNVSWVWDNSKSGLADLTGVHLPPPGATVGQVAGAFISAQDRPADSGGLSVDSLYSLLIR